MAHCTQLCTTKKNFYSQQIKIFFLGITLFDTFSLLFQKEKNLMPLFLIACNRGLSHAVYGLLSVGKCYSESEGIDYNSRQGVYGRISSCTIWISEQSNESKTNTVVTVTLIKLAIHV